MNILPTEKRAQILHHLVEGCSMRNTCPLTGANKKTFDRLLVAAGTARRISRQPRSQSAIQVLQLDEIWAFVGSKKANTEWILRDTGTRGDVWSLEEVVKLIN